MPSNFFNDDNRKNNDEKKNKPSSRTIALDKLEIRDEELRVTRRPKRSGKINGRPKNVFVRFAVAAFPQAEDATGEKLRKIFLILAVAVLIGALIYLGWQISSIDKGTSINTHLAEIAGSPMDPVTSSYSRPHYIENPSPIIPTTQTGTEEPPFFDLTPVKNTPLNINFDKLTAENPDTRAWIKITDTMINNVVVQTDNNDYYLKHDFNGNPSETGTIYSSYLNKWDGTDDNTILFGHNCDNGQFFSYIIHYYPDEYSRDPLYFYKVHPTIMLATPDGGSQTYKVFAGVLANTKSEYGEVFRYVNKTKFDDVNDFNNFILDVMDRSFFFTEVDITYGDELLTLSTCHWPYGRKIDTRWVVFARKVRPGESEEVNTAVAYRNYQAKMFDYVYKLNQTSWAGSVWDKSKLLSY